MSPRSRQVPMGRQVPFSTPCCATYPVPTLPTRHGDERVGPGKQSLTLGSPILVCPSLHNLQMKITCTSRLKILLYIHIF